MLTTEGQDVLRACLHCGARLYFEPHATAACPGRPVVFPVSTDAAGRKLELLLESCTRRAVRSWAASGRPL